MQWCHVWTMKSISNVNIWRQEKMMAIMFDCNNDRTCNRSFAICWDIRQFDCSQLFAVMMIEIPFELINGLHWIISVLRSNRRACTWSMLYSLFNNEGSMRWIIQTAFPFFFFFSSHFLVVALTDENNDPADMSPSNRMKVNLNSHNDKQRKNDRCQ
jgi:hypothetical protein